MAKLVRIDRILECRDGTAILEFAFALPVLLTILLGILSYGQWFYFAQAMQQVANDAARAALPGLSSSERAGLAQTAANQDLSGFAGLSMGATRFSIQDDGTQVRVTMSYDAGGSILLRNSLVPLPSTTINRTAIIQLGNF